MDFPAIPTLETERLLLRPFRADDFENYLAIRTDPEVQRHLDCGPAPWSRMRAWNHLAFLIGHWQLRGAGSWALEEKASGAFVGLVGFYQPEDWPGFELAWALARSHWGKGFATEAAQVALDYAFAVLGEDVVISLISPKNAASIRVAERLGQTREGRHPMQSGDRVIYRMTRARYAELRSAGVDRDAERAASAW
jgi:RimJ/RimL family protein N-acetyltransferase